MWPELCSCKWALLSCWPRPSLAETYFFPNALYKSQKSDRHLRSTSAIATCVSSSQPESPERIKYQCFHFKHYQLIPQRRSFLFSCTFCHLSSNGSVMLRELQVPINKQGSKWNAPHMRVKEGFNGNDAWKVLRTTPTTQWGVPEMYYWILIINSIVF